MFRFYSVYVFELCGFVTKRGFTLVETKKSPSYSWLETSHTFYLLRLTVKGNEIQRHCTYNHITKDWIVLQALRDRFVLYGVMYWTKSKGQIGNAKRQAEMQYSFWNAAFQFKFWYIKPNSAILTWRISNRCVPTWRISNRCIPTWRIPAWHISNRCISTARSSCISHVTM